MKRDFVGVVEAAYSLEGDTQAWVGRIAEAAGPSLDDGLGFMVFGFEHHHTRGFMPTTQPSGLPSGDGSDRLVEAVASFLQAMPPDLGTRGFFEGPPVATLSAVLGPEGFAAMRPPLEQFCHPFGVRDMLGIRAIDPRRRGVVISKFLPSTGRAAPRTAWAWSRVAAHLATALRVREALAASNEDPASTAEAVLSPGGKILHANADAQEGSSRAALTAAALAMDSSRSKMRREDPEGALDLWKAMVRGKWSIIDHHDTDGRRFLLVRRNDAPVPDPRALSHEERQVVAYAALGHSGKLIGYELGLAPQTVADHLKSAMRKLRVRSCAELIRVFSSAQGAPLGS